MRVQAQVMTRDDSSGGWVPMGGGGLSYVGLVRRLKPGTEDTNRRNEYLIYGQRIADNSVSTFQCKIVNIFLPINFNICFGCSQEPPH